MQGELKPYSWPSSFQRRATIDLLVWSLELALECPRSGYDVFCGKWTQFLFFVLKVLGRILDSHGLSWSQGLWTVRTCDDWRRHQRVAGGPSHWCCWSNMMRHWVEAHCTAPLSEVAISHGLWVFIRLNGWHDPYRPYPCQPRVKAPKWATCSKNHIFRLSKNMFLDRLLDAVKATATLRSTIHFMPFHVTFLIELDDMKIYRKALYSMVKTMVSCRFSLKPIHWISVISFYTEAVIAESQHQGREGEGAGFAIPPRDVALRSGCDPISTQNEYPLVN